MPAFILIIILLSGWATVPAPLAVPYSDDAPVLSGIETAPLAYTENGAAKVITSKITVKDADDVLLVSANVWISQNYQNGKDLLLFTDNNGITGTWSTETGVLSLAGSSSVANYQSALRSIKYFNNSNDPSVVARTVSFIVNDGSANSNTVTRQITVTAVNDAPVLSNIETTSLRYTENDSTAFITGTLKVTDEDDLNLESAVVRISINYQIGQDILVFKNTSSITGVWNSGTGILNLSGTSTVENYQEALHSITYYNTSDKPSTLTRTISFRVNDGSLNSATVSRQVTVTPVNDNPVLSDIESVPLEYSENAPAVSVTATIKVSDADDINIESAVVSISSDYQNGEDLLSFTNNNGISGSWNSNSGILTLTGRSSVANYQTALRSITYSNKSDNPHLIPRIVSFIVNDGDIDSPAATREISIIPVNDAPVLLNIETTSLVYTENDPPKIITYKIEVTDADDVDLDSAHVWISVNYLKGQDILSFTGANAITGKWDNEKGLLCLSGSSSVVNYQDALRSITYYNSSDNPSPLLRTMSFIVYDGNLSSKTITRQIAITPVNDAPTAGTVAIHGGMIVDSTLTGSYIYSDAENDPEGASSFRWFRSDDSEGTNETAIPDAVSRTYLLSAADSKKYICFEVTPAAASGSTPGIAVKSVRQPVITFPDGWKVNPEDFIYSGRVTAQVLINGKPVESGFLAAFASEECRGIAKPVYYAPSGQYIFELTCYSNVLTGEVLTFRYYSITEDLIYNMDRSVDFEPDMNVGTAGFPFEMHNGTLYSVAFQEGWNWFSVNTFLDNMTLNFILSSENTHGDYIKDQSNSSTYYSGYGWFGSLMIIEPEKLYKINVQNGSIAEFTGRPVDAGTKKIPVVSGWNWIGYLPQKSMPTGSALSSLSLAELDYIKNQTNSATYYSDYGWFGSLTVMEPNVGYMLKLSNPGTLVYPEPGKSGIEEIKKKNEPAFNPADFEFNGEIMAKVLVGGVPKGSEADRLYAFVNDEIRGIAGGLYFDATGAWVYSLLIYSNQPLGENVTFRYFNAENDEYYSCRDTIAFSNDMIIGNALNPFKLDFYSPDANELESKNKGIDMIAYPNPFDHSVNIEYKIPDLTNVRISVYDSYGNPVSMLLNKDLESGHYLIKWDSGTEPAGIYFIRLQAGYRLKVHKVILMP